MDLKPALTYPDGFSIYSWHGVRMPANIIETPAGNIDCQKILEEKNAGIRMAAIQKVGLLRLRNSLPCKIISKSETAEMIEFKLANNLKIRGLHVRWETKDKQSLETILIVPSTKEQFGEDSPDNIDDAEQVRKWTLWANMKDEFVMET